MDEVQNSVVFQTLPPSVPIPVTVPPPPPSSSSSTPSKTGMKERWEEKKWTETNDDNNDYTSKYVADVDRKEAFEKRDKDRDFEGGRREEDDVNDGNDGDQERDGDYSSDHSGSGNTNSSSRSSSSSSSVSSAVSASSAGALARAAGSVMYSNALSTVVIVISSFTLIHSIVSCD